MSIMELHQLVRLCRSETESFEYLFQKKKEQIGIFLSSLRWSRILFHEFWKASVQQLQDRLQSIHWYRICRIKDIMRFLAAPYQAVWTWTERAKSQYPIRPQLSDDFEGIWYPASLRAARSIEKWWSSKRRNRCRWVLFWREMKREKRQRSRRKDNSIWNPWAWR